MRRAFPLGIASLAVGIGLYVVAAAVALSYYDGQPRPAWLTTLWFFAVALVVAGLLTLVSGAVTVSRGRR
ncbi:MAG TPA: hypothetical protein VHQ98_07600 [Gaiellaceae bacterium]|nr:hypothetical protein [Gaiellaceae bacterium]